MASKIDYDSKLKFDNEEYDKEIILKGINLETLDKNVSCRNIAYSNKYGLFFVCSDRDIKILDYQNFKLMIKNFHKETQGGDTVKVEDKFKSFLTNFGATLTSIKIIEEEGILLFTDNKEIGVLDLVSLEGDKEEIKLKSKVEVEGEKVRDFNWFDGQVAYVNSDHSFVCGEVKVSDVLCFDVCRDGVERLMLLKADKTLEIRDTLGQSGHKIEILEIEGTDMLKKRTIRYSNIFFYNKNQFLVVIAGTNPEDDDMEENFAIQFYSEQEIDTRNNGSGLKAFPSNEDEEILTWADPFGDREVDEINFEFTYVQENNLGFIYADGSQTIQIINTCPGQLGIVDIREENLPVVPPDGLDVVDLRGMVSIKNPIQGEGEVNIMKNTTVRNDDGEPYKRYIQRRLLFINQKGVMIIRCLEDCRDEQLDKEGNDPTPILELPQREIILSGDKAVGTTVLGNSIFGPGKGSSVTAGGLFGAGEGMFNKPNTSGNLFGGGLETIRNEAEEEKEESEARGGGADNIFGNGISLFEGVKKKDDVKSGLDLFSKSTEKGITMFGGAKVDGDSKDTGNIFSSKPSNPLFGGDSKSKSKETEGGGLFSNTPNPFVSEKKGGLFKKDSKVDESKEEKHALGGIFTNPSFTLGGTTKVNEGKKDEKKDIFNFGSPNMKESKKVKEPTKNLFMNPEDKDEKPTQKESFIFNSMKEKTTESKSGLFDSKPTKKDEKDEKDEKKEDPLSLRLPSKTFVKDTASLIQKENALADTPETSATDTILLNLAKEEKIPEHLKLRFKSLSVKYKQTLEKLGKSKPRVKKMSKENTAVSKKLIKSSKDSQALFKDCLTDLEKFNVKISDAAEMTKPTKRYIHILRNHLAQYKRNKEQYRGYFSNKVTKLYENITDKIEKVKNFNIMFNEVRSNLGNLKDSFEGINGQGGHGILSQGRTVSFENFSADFEDRVYKRGDLKSSKDGQSSSFFGNVSQIKLKNPTNFYKSELSGVKSIKAPGKSSMITSSGNRRSRKLKNQSVFGLFQSKSSDFLEDYYKEKEQILENLQQEINTRIADKPMHSSRIYLSMDMDLDAEIEEEKSTLQSSKGDSTVDYYCLDSFKTKRYNLEVIEDNFNQITNARITCNARLNQKLNKPFVEKKIESKFSMSKKSGQKKKMTTISSIGGGDKKISGAGFLGTSSSSGGMGSGLFGASKPADKKEEKKVVDTGKDAMQLGGIFGKKDKPQAPSGGLFGAKTEPKKEAKKEENKPAAMTGLFGSKTESKEESAKKSGSMTFGGGAGTGGLFSSNKSETKEAKPATTLGGMFASNSQAKQDKKEEEKPKTDTSKASSSIFGNSTTQGANLFGKPSTEEPKLQSTPPKKEAQSSSNLFGQATNAKEDKDDQPPNSVLRSQPGSSNLFSNAKKEGQASVGLFGESKVETTAKKGQGMMFGSQNDGAQEKTEENKKDDQGANIFGTSTSTGGGLNFGSSGGLGGYSQPGMFGNTKKDDKKQGGSSGTNIFGNQQTGSTSTNIFGGGDNSGTQVQNTTGIKISGLDNQSSSIFGNKPTNDTPAASSNIFGNQGDSTGNKPSTSSNIFGGGNTASKDNQSTSNNIFGASGNGNNNTSSSGMFSTQQKTQLGNVKTDNIFQSSAQNQSIGGYSKPAGTQQGFSFGQTSSSFGISSEIQGVVRG